MLKLSTPSWNFMWFFFSPILRLSLFNNMDKKKQIWLRSQKLKCCSFSLKIILNASISVSFRPATYILHGGQRAQWYVFTIISNCLDNDTWARGVPTINRNNFPSLKQKLDGAGIKITGLILAWETLIIIISEAGEKGWLLSHTKVTGDVGNPTCTYRNLWRVERKELYG